MEDLKSTTYTRFVEWLPDLSIAQINVEFKYNKTSDPELLEELNFQHSNISRDIKEGTLKEICNESIQNKMLSVVGGSRLPRHFKMYHSSTNASWDVNITAMPREATTTEDIIHIDEWEAAFYKAMWIHVVSKN